MVEVIQRVMRLDAQNLIPMVQQIALGVWCLVVVAGIWSIRFQPISLAAQIVWAVIIIGLPLLGMLIYCVYCLPRTDWGPLQGFRLGRSNPDKAKPVRPHRIPAGPVRRGLPN